MPSESEKRGYALNDNPLVEEIAQLRLTGTLVPQHWFKKLTFPSGKAYSLAVLILADLIYWYRPIEIRDEGTGEVVEFRKRFEGDKLQRTYDDWGEMFGHTKRQAQDALHFLRDKALVVIEYKDVTLKSGVVLRNVTFFAPVPSAIRKLNILKADVIRVPAERDTSPAETSDVSRSAGGQSTETSTKTSTEKEKKPPRAANADAGNQVSHSILMQTLHDRYGPISDGAKQGKYVKWLLDNQYTVADCVACLDGLRSEAWRTTRVDWCTVAKEIGTWRARNNGASGQSKSGSGFNQTEVGGGGTTRDERRYAELRRQTPELILGTPTASNLD